MSTAQYLLSLQLSVLAAARSPEWSTVSDYTTLADRPSTANDGVSLLANEAEGVLATHVRLSPRAQAYRRKVTFEITTFDAAANYTITLNGTGYTSTTPADEDTALSDLETAIDAAGYTASVADQVLTILGPDADSFSVDFTVTGSAVATCSADAESCTLHVFTQGKDTTATPWCLKESRLVTDAGLEDVFCTAGRARLYTQLTNVVGHPLDGSAVTLTFGDIRVGPAILES